MAINTFTEKAVKFLPILDEIYAKQALTANLDNPTLAARFVGTNKIKLPKISVDGAANYDRDTGYVQGGVTVNYEEHELKYDRSRKFRIDVIDDDESAFDLFRRATTEYVRLKEIPELDAIRFAEIFDAASRGGSKGTVVEKDLAAGDKALALFDAAEQALNEKEVPEEGRVLYCSNDFYLMLKNDPAISRRIDVNGNNGSVDRRVQLLDGVTLTTFGKGKNSDWTSNRVIRVLDSWANDVARIFGASYIGLQTNDAIGRQLFKADLVSLAKQYQSIQAISNFSPEDIEIAQGQGKRDVAVSCALQPNDSMEKLYMVVTVI